MKDPRKEGTSNWVTKGAQVTDSSLVLSLTCDAIY